MEFREAVLLVIIFGSEKKVGSNSQIVKKSEMKTAKRNAQIVICEKLRLD